MNEEQKVHDAVEVPPISTLEEAINEVLKLVVRAVVALERIATAQERIAKVLEK